MSANYKQLEQFTKNLEKLNEQQKDQFLQSCAKELAARLLAKVIKRTPVGKKPKMQGSKTIKVQGSSGKSQTFLSVEGARHEKYWSDYQGGTLRRGWTAGKSTNAVEYAKSLNIQHIGDKYIIDIVNPVEYASYVEYGHRQNVGQFVPALGKRLKSGWIPGHFMLTISEKEIQNSQQAILQAKLNKYMKDVFKV